MIDILFRLADVLLNIDKYLSDLTNNYGVYIYLLLFIVIFLETGVVATPFLPGDSLLFAAGAIAASASGLNVWILFVVISVAAIIGDSVNYSIGKYLGIKIFQHGNPRIFKKEYLEKTEFFYQKHGSKAIILGRFFPIVRTFVPFVAGIGKMEYRRFILYNIAGGILWTSVFVSGGYLFGNVPIVKENFTVVIFGIILLSITPAIYHLLIKSKTSACSTAEPCEPS